MALVVEAFDGCVLDGAVHPFDLPVGPWVVRLGEAMLDIVRLADHVEAHLAREGGVPIARLVGELDAVVGQDGVDAIGHGFQQMFEKLPGRSPVCLLDELSDRELAGAVDADEQVELAFGSLHLGNIDVEEPDWIAFEALTFGLVALDVGQARDAVSLQAPMQR